MDIKNPKDPLYSFRHTDTVQILIFCFLKKFSMFPRGPLQFFDVLQQEGCYNSQISPLFSAPGARASQADGAPIRSFGFFESVSKRFCEFFIKNALRKF